MAQFLCLKNIREFLKSCSGVFGIKETDLFQPSMLYDYSDFARVLHTLSRLSNCQKARTRISGFPVQAGTLGASTSHDEDQVIEKLMYDYCRDHCIHIGTELSTMTFYQFFLIINPTIYLAK